jgi:serine/threonine protein kinase
MWSVGCIFFEMAHKRPLFYGDSEIGQIFKIFKIMGTPTEDTWQGITDLPEFKVSFPQWKVNAIENLKKMCSNMDDIALDLLV